MKQSEPILELLQILLYGAARHQCALSARKTPTFRVLFWWLCLEMKLFYFSIKSAAWLPICQIETIGLSNRAPSNGVCIVILIYSTLYLCSFYLLLVNFMSSSGLPFLDIFVFILSHLVLVLQLFLFSETGAVHCNGVWISKEVCAEEDHYYVLSNPKREHLGSISIWVVFYKAFSPIANAGYLLGKSIH